MQLKVVELTLFIAPKSINLQLFILILYGFGVRCDLRRFSVIDQSIYREVYGGKTGKVFYCQEPRSRESTTTECGVNYQLLAVVDNCTEAAQWGNS